MSTPGLVKARWLPVWSAMTPHGEIHHGDTLLIPEGEARASSHWEIVSERPASKPSTAKDE